MALEDSLKHIVGLCKRRGFIFPGSEIYGGLANTWDYGPYGVEMKNNIKKRWWRDFITSRRDTVGLDSGILLNPKVWEASGHTTSFSDPLIDCKSCKARLRGDELIEAKLGKGSAAEMDLDQVRQAIEQEGITCPQCGGKDFTEPRAFNLMFKTFQGVVEDTSAAVYLRPETAQGIFLNFKNIVTTCRQRVPFGIGQIGKSFRNEITPGNFTFRTREFEQMEMEFFVKPGTEMEWFEYWKQFCMDWLNRLGLSAARLRFRDHAPEELSHYSNATTDIEYKYPFGWGELWGVASRTDYDLKSHAAASAKDLKYQDPQTNEKYLPCVIEPALGADRLALTVLVDAYTEEEVDGEKRVVLKLQPDIAPVKIAVFPLMKKKPLEEKAQGVYNTIMESGRWACEYDISGSIGKRYRRQDELGTPYCVTVDYETVEDDDSVTVRHRDTMEQTRVPIPRLVDFFLEHLGNV